MSAARIALTLLSAVMSGVAAGGTIRVEFTAEADETEGAEAYARNIQGSFSFDTSKQRSDTASLIGSYVQTELIEFTIITELGRVSADIGQVMHYGDDQPGLLNSVRNGLAYRVEVGVVSYPPPNDQGSGVELDAVGGQGVDFDDLHTFNIDFPQVSRPLVTFDLVHSPTGDRTQRSLVPPPMQEIKDAKN